jgi:hypothetical protein
MLAGALIPEIKGVAVDVGLAVFGLEGEAYAGLLRHQRINLFQPRANLGELHSLCKREVQVFGKTIVSEVAAFEGGAAFEDEQVAELALAQAGKEPGETVIPLQYGPRECDGHHLPYTAGLREGRDCAAGSCVRNRLQFVDTYVELQTPARLKGT